MAIDKNMTSNIDWGWPLAAAPFFASYAWLPWRQKIGKRFSKKTDPRGSVRCLERVMRIELTTLTLAT